jgi:hypothetical protein
MRHPVNDVTVIPAKAGIHVQWTPAFAGVTARFVSLQRLQPSRDFSHELGRHPTGAELALEGVSIGERIDQLGRNQGHDNVLPGGFG